MIINRSIPPIALIFFMLICLNFAGCLPADAQEAPKPTYIFTYSATSPPYAFLDADGQPQGLLIDLWTLWAKKTNVNLKFKLVTWQDSLELVKSGQAHANAGAYFSVERAKDFFFSKAVIPVQTSIFVNDSSVKIVKDLYGREVGVLAGDRAAEYLRNNHPKIIVREFMDNYSLVGSAAIGDIRAFAKDDPIARVFMNKYDILGKFDQIPIYEDNFYALVSKEHPDLVKLINEGLNQISQRERRRLEEIWLADRIRIPTRVIYCMITLFVLLVTAGVVTWIVTLRKKVRLRTAELEKHKNRLEELVRERTAELAHANDQLKQEIAERRKTERSLRTSENRYRSIFENSKVAVFRIRLHEGTIIAANKHMAEMFGYDSIEEFISEYKMPDGWVDIAQREKLYEQLQRDGFARGFEAQFRKRNSESFWVQFSPTIYPELGYMEGVGVDITEEKNAREAIARSEERFRTLTNLTSAMIFIVTDNFEIAYANRTALETLGYKWEELQGSQSSILFDSDSYDKILSAEQDVSAGSDTPRLEVQFVTKSGEKRWFELTGGFIDMEGRLHRLSTAYDITNRKESAEALARSEEKFRTLAETTSALVMMSTISEKGAASIRYTNKAAKTILGYDPEEMMGIEPQKLISEESRERLLGVWQKAIMNGQTRVEKVEIMVYTKSGRSRWLEFNGSILELPDGMIGLSISFDITDRIKAEAAIRDSEARYRTIFETTGTATVIFGEDCIIRLANTEFEHISGYRREEVEGQITWKDFFDKASLEEIEKAAENVSRQTDQPLGTHETSLIDRNGGIHQGMVTINRIPGSDQHVASFLDMTERKQAEQQMFRAEKMAALGQIIAGVAHEINNPNNFITFNLPILRRYIEAAQELLDRCYADEPGMTILNMPYDKWTEDVFKLVENMQYGSKRITGIVSELKSYIRSHEQEEMKEEGMDHVVEHVMTLVGKQVRKMVKRFDLRIEPGLPRLHMNPGKIEQVLINLIINAGQAANKDDSFVELKVSLSDTKPGFLEIIVEDNGAGISPEMQNKIFDPFFTTKGRDAGTGLGLAISQRTVEEHNGTIEVASTPGLGTKFTIFLPINGRDKAQ